MSTETQQRAPHRAPFLLFAAVSMVWLFVSSGIIVVNKMILVDYEFPYPMAVSCLGMVFSSVATWLGGPVFNLFARSHVMDRRTFLTKIMPVGLSQACTMFTGNFAYVFLSVAFIQMSKSLTPVVTMLGLFIAQLEYPTSNLIASVLVISVGTAIAAWGEVRFSFVGLLLILTSEFAEAVRLVLTQYLLVGVKLEPLEGLMYMAPASMLWLALGSVVAEFPKMHANQALLIPLQHPGPFLLAAVSGFLVSILGFVIIKMSSALTMKVLVIVRGMALVLIGWVFMKEVITPHQFFGYLVSLAGVVWYNHLKLYPSIPS